MTLDIFLFLQHIIDQEIFVVKFIPQSQNLTVSEHATPSKVKAQLLL